MLRTAIALCLLSITLIFNGCCHTPKPCPVVPQKCVIPYTPYADINNTLCSGTDFKCITIKALSNYEAKKQEADLLRSNSEVCR